jgi:predicted  nucleic acid-binding Zn-ribbon protein
VKQTSESYKELTKALKDLDKAKSIQDKAKADIRKAYAPFMKDLKDIVDSEDKLSDEVTKFLNFLKERQKKEKELSDKIDKLKTAYSGTSKEFNAAFKVLSDYRQPGATSKDLAELFIASTKVNGRLYSDLSVEEGS